jgi:hypothetical protein
MFGGIFYGFLLGYGHGLFHLRDMGLNDGQYSILVLAVAVTVAVGFPFIAILLALPIIYALRRGKPFLLTAAERAELDRDYAKQIRDGLMATIWQLGVYASLNGLSEYMAASYVR